MASAISAALADQHARSIKRLTPAARSVIYRSFSRLSKNGRVAQGMLLFGREELGFGNAPHGTQ
jgi:hypothetical protein